MELTPAHLRYLLAIYEVSQTHLDISSRSIAEKLGVEPEFVEINWDLLPQADALKGKRTGLRGVRFFSYAGPQTR